MATIKVPAQDANLCDICGRCEALGLLRKCICCGLEFCLACDAIIPGCIHRPDVCKRCGNEDRVITLCDAAAKEMIPILKRRDAKIRQLKIKRESIVERFHAAD